MVRFHVPVDRLRTEVLHCPPARSRCLPAHEAYGALGRFSGEGGPFLLRALIDLPCVWVVASPCRSFRRAFAPSSFSRNSLTASPGFCPFSIASRRILSISDSCGENLPNCSIPIVASIPYTAHMKQWLLFRGSPSDSALFSYI